MSRRVAAGRLRFSLRQLLIIPIVAAVGLWIWSRYVYVHPAHRNPNYERAPYARSLHVTLGTNRFAIQSVARSDRDGSVIVENGAGRRSKKQVAYLPELGSSGSWLDTAQIEFMPTPGTTEVLQARIFDHQTRELITKTHPRSGWRMIDRNTLHIYRLGARLPDTLDVWFRIHSYDASDAPVQLAVETGASCDLGHASLSILDIQEGYLSYSSDSGLVGTPSDHDCSLVVRLSGDPGQETKYQLTAVGRDGRRVLMYGAPMFLRPGSLEVLHLYLALEDIEHLEVRPFGGRRRFFFDGVRLPNTSQTPFQSPPVATVHLNGSETKQCVADFVPLRLALRIRRGAWATGIGANDAGCYIQARRNGPQNVDTETTLTYHLDGITNVPLNFSGPVPNSQRWSRLPTTGRSSSSWNSSSQVCFQTLSTPIEKLQAMRVQFAAP